MSIPTQEGFVVRCQNSLCEMVRETQRKIGREGNHCHLRPDLVDLHTRCLNLQPLDIARQSDKLQGELADILSRAEESGCAERYCGLNRISAVILEFIAQNSDSVSDNI